MALLKKAFQESLSLGRAAEDGNGVRRHEDYADDLPLVDPHDEARRLRIYWIYPRLSRAGAESDEDPETTAE